jgi:hypothetical protein
MTVALRHSYLVAGKHRRRTRKANPHRRIIHEMNTNIARSFARYIALPIVSAGIIGGAAVGMAGMANAAPSLVETNGDGSVSIVATPDTKAQPAPEVSCLVHDCPDPPPSPLQPTH